MASVGSFDEEKGDRSIHVLPPIATRATVINVHSAEGVRPERPDHEKEAKLTRPNHGW